MFWSALFFTSRWICLKHGGFVCRSLQKVIELLLYFNFQSLLLFVILFDNPFLVFLFVNFVLCKFLFESMVFLLKLRVLLKDFGKFMS